MAHLCRGVLDQYFWINDEIWQEEGKNRLINICSYPFPYSRRMPRVITAELILPQLLIYNEVFCWHMVEKEKNKAILTNKSSTMMLGR